MHQRNSIAWPAPWGGLGGAGGLTFNRSRALCTVLCSIINFITNNYYGKVIIVVIVNSILCHNYYNIINYHNYNK